MISALDRKALRELVHMRGQILAIVLVLACGIAGFVTMISNLQALERSMLRYYEHNHFADVFASVVRAPESRMASAISRSSITMLVRIIRLPLQGVSFYQFVHMACPGRPSDGHPEPVLNLEALHATKFADISTDQDSALLQRVGSNQQVIGTNRPALGFERAANLRVDAIHTGLERCNLEAREELLDPFSQSR